mmetsp:Transcript_37403/g.69231  ORF Transcript_37403/g.69231 Transcript_37403/m.69231 type:complete len:516 (-) Transcript_37403:150-1697(-)
MNQSSNDYFDKRNQKRSNSKPNAAASKEPATETTSKTNPLSFNPVTPAEYIYNAMIPPSKSPSLPDATEEIATLGKRERCNTGGSSVPPGPMLSMDLYLTSDDLQVDIGDVEGMLALNSDNAGGLRSLQSADIVQSMLLPDVASTAAVALRGVQHQHQPPPQSMGSNRNANTAPSQIMQQQQAMQKVDKPCPVMKLTAKLERISTADEIAPLNEKFRVSSTDWVKDFDGSDPGPMHPSLFMGNNAIRNPSPAPLTTNSGGPAAPPPANNYFSEYQIPLAGSSSRDDWIRVANTLSATPIPLPTTSSNPPPTNPSYREPSQTTTIATPMLPRSNPNIMCNLPTPSATAPIAIRSSNNTTSSPSSSTTSKRRKRKKKRTINESVAVEPTDDDVLFGRGGFTNTHPGNIRFRTKALELRSWYELPATTKEEKYEISDLLVESVKGCGHRFLERGEDGLWHEVIGNGARKKASQALRERVKGKRPSAGTDNKLVSSGTAAGKDDGKDLTASVTGDVVGI